jgi:hypothetical protein
MARIDNTSENLLHHIRQNDNDLFILDEPFNLNNLLNSNIYLLTIISVKSISVSKSVSVSSIITVEFDETRVHHRRATCGSE